MSDMTLASKAEAATSNNVYVLSEEHAWVPARVVTTNGDTATVSIPLYKDEQLIQSDGGHYAKGFERKDISLNEYSGKVLPLQNVDEHGVLKQVQDMVDLPFLHEVSRKMNDLSKSRWNLFLLSSLVRLPFCII